MDCENMKKHIATYRMLQEIPALDMPCPRCGKNKLKSDMIQNCLSRHEDIYICNECGQDEAGFDMAGLAIPLEKWYAVRFLNGEILPYERKMPDESLAYYLISSSVNAKVYDEDIDDIMITALEGGITYWCDKAEVVGRYLGEMASEQISRGGELRLHDCEEDEIYVLTLDKFLQGLSMYICRFYEIAVNNGRVDPGEIDAEGADCIVQYALFGEVIYG